MLIEQDDLRSFSLFAKENDGGEPPQEAMDCEDDEEPPMKGRTLGWYIEARARQDRKPFEPWDVAVEYVKAKRFRTMQDFAKFFGHDPSWATGFKVLAISQGVFTIEEWKACFQRGHNLGRPIEDGRTWAELQAQQEQPAIEPVEDDDDDDEPYFVTRLGYEEPFSVVLERIKHGELRSVSAICRFYYRCQPQNVDALREDVINRGLVTDEQWQALMKKRTEL